MDTTDLKILSFLQQDARISMTKLSKLVNLSSPSVAERIKKLEDNGVITRYTATVDPAKLNRVIKTFFFITVPPEKRSRLIKILEECPDICWVDIVSGRYTAIACAQTHDMEDVLSIVAIIQQFGSTETAISLSSPIENRILEYYNK